MTDPTLTDQISAILSAPIPFFFALFAIVAPTVFGIWRAFDWRYGALMEKYKGVYELALKENEVARKKQEELEATTGRLSGEVEKMRQGAAPPTDELLAVLSSVKEQLEGLRKANTSVTDTISTAPFLSEWFVPTNERARPMLSTKALADILAAANELKKKKRD
ncbi:MAG: hypothetical protein WED13_09480 [Methyloceanibacter sp.]